LGIGLRPNKPVPKWRRISFVWLSTTFSRVGRFAFGIWFTVNHEDFDYSEYLGPNWRKELKEYKKPVPTVVINHNSFYDIFAL
jgi:catalase (peroxidase I)